MSVYNSDEYNIKKQQGLFISTFKFISHKPQTTNHQQGASRVAESDTSENIGSFFSLFKSI